ncbi:MAG: nucleotidyl transferase AbiEii/AbiGii toxin family protein [Acidobacteria bacterium]|nr:nucleotidyl transferase AbiEii/AbiGii toxin family protein [Acidobacteriota bacterium]
MPEAFLQLPRKRQKEILATVASQIGLSPTALEKDVWLCWVIQHLFVTPRRLPMALKGGTSLSKVYEVIHRFSEDVDITLDYRTLNDGFDPFSPEASGQKRRKFRDQLDAGVLRHVQEIVLPHFQGVIENEIGSEEFTLEVGQDKKGVTLSLSYPSVLDEASSYIKSQVRVEFGGSNVTEPSREFAIRPYVATHLPALSFPEASPIVLSCARTFWEKATLIHMQCNRSQLNRKVEHLSRHWYDLAMLADHRLGVQALAERSLFQDVVKHKKAFFSSSYANYDDCLNGKLRLLPDEGMLRELRTDFQEMLSAGMYYGTPPLFNNVIEKLRTLERQINSTESGTTLAPAP